MQTSHIAVLISRLHLSAIKPLVKQSICPSRVEILQKRPKRLAMSLIFLLLCCPWKVPLTWSESNNYTKLINSLEVEFGVLCDFMQLGN